MRASCNGCRILRKGCSDDCAIRPSLLWLPDPEHQANATLFLAKFYGRAGLLNLLSAAPDRLRHAVFRSLLYEACGRIVNPIYGSVGLLWSGNWKLCQAAVEAVLKGSPVLQMAPDALAAVPLPPLQAFDIRHVSKNQGTERAAYKVAKNTQFKRSGGSLIVDLNKVMMVSGEQRWGEVYTENESLMSSETVELAAVERRTYDAGDGAAGSSGHENLRLELSLGWEAPSP